MKFLVSFFIFISFLNIKIFAQPGTLDPGFGNNGIVSSGIFVDPDGIAMQKDGKILVCNTSNIARFNPNGSIDSTFGANGIINLTDSYKGFSCISVLHEESIIAGGLMYKDFFYDDNIGEVANMNFLVMKYKPDGSTDSSFGINGTASMDFGSAEFTTDIAVQPDGKIVLSGYSNYPKSFALTVRLNADGTIDNSFGNDGEVQADLGYNTSIANSISLQTDGKIVLGGTYNWTSYPAFLLLRYLPDGTPDTTFGNNGNVITDFGSKTILEFGNSTAISSEGKIILSGYNKTSGFFPKSNILLARYNGNGTPDENFGENGTVITHIDNVNTQSYSVVIQDNGKIVAGGTAQSDQDDFILIRYNADGSQDSSFGENGITITDIDYADHLKKLALQKDGKIIATGSAPVSGTQNSLALVRYFGDGAQNYLITKIKTWINNNVLGWYTTNNSRVDYYSIQSSSNRSSFKEVKRVKAENAPEAIQEAESNKKETYNYVLSAAADNSYYRIAAIKKDGRITYSDIIYYAGNKSLVTVYPNPVKDIMHVSGLTASYKTTLCIINSQGNVLKKVNGNGSSYDFNVSQLKQGTYYLRVEEGINNKAYQFIKE